MNTSDKLDSGVYLQSKIIKAKFENNNKLYESNTPPTILSLYLSSLFDCLACGVRCGGVVRRNLILPSLPTSHETRKSESYNTHRPRYSWFYWIFRIYWEQQASR